MKTDGMLIDPDKEPVIAPVGQFRRGDVVYFKSGGYPMTIQFLKSGASLGGVITYARLVWHNEYGDLNECECDVKVLQRAEQ